MRSVNFDAYYTNKETDDDYFLLTAVGSTIYGNYLKRLKIYTDVSLLNNNISGTAVVNSEPKRDQRYNIGKDCSVFTSELTATLMTLGHTARCPVTIFDAKQKQRIDKTHNKPHKQ